MFDLEPAGDVADHQAELKNRGHRYAGEYSHEQRPGSQRAVHQAEADACEQQDIDNGVAGEVVVMAEFAGLAGDPGQFPVGVVEKIGHRKAQGAGIDQPRVPGREQRAGNHAGEQSHRREMIGGDGGIT